MKLRKYIKYTLLIIILFVFLLGIGYSFHNKSIESTNINTEEKVDIPNKNPEANLTFVGDFLYEEPYYDALKAGENINHYFSKVRKYFENDDLSIGNMEVVIDDGTMKISGSNYSFCAPQSIGYEVASLDMEVLGLANNHANDRGIAGRISTVKFFKDNSDILTIGTYDSKNPDLSSNIIEVNGIKFGFLAYTKSTNKKIALEDRYTLGLFRDPDTGTITEEYKEKIAKEVNYLRDKVDCLIVLTHWGQEYTYVINDNQEELTKFLNGLGVDIIIGAHPHNMQKIEWYNTINHNTLVFYSMGNFVSADYIVPGAREEFTKSYQIGLMGKLKVTKNDGKIEISDIKTEPIINYYDKNLKNFLLIPYNEYDENYEKSHYLYNKGFTKDFVEATYNKVIPDEFRNRINDI